MKSIVLISCLIVASFSALAEKPCYEQMSASAYNAYSKSEKITIQEAKSTADLFINSFKSVSNRKLYEVEIAEQYSTDSESGYFPGTKFKITLTNTCLVLSTLKI